MLSFIRDFSFYLWVLICLVPSIYGQGVIDLGVIDRNLETKVIRVAVSSTDKGVETSLRRLFRLHGAFELTEANKAQFTIKYIVESESTGEIRILSGNPAQVVWRSPVSSPLETESVLLAADRIVSKTTGLKGFFSKAIAFVSDRSGYPEIYLSNILFNKLSQLTHDGSLSIKPAISPDGKILLYTSFYRNGFPDIYRIQLNTGKRELFAGFKGTNTGATWSPDGHRVAMILSGSGNSEVYTCSAQGRDFHRVTKTKGLESDPTWSPNGSRMVFASDMLGKPQLFIQTVQLSRKPTRIPTNISGYCAEPDWNPVEENLLAFTIAQNQEFEVALYDFKTKKSRVITRGVGDALEPVWMTDGRHLIYTERTSKYRKLVLMDTQSGKSLPLNSLKWGNAYQANVQ